MDQNAKLTVFYDGLCHLCSREIKHYRGMRGAENIVFVDITGPGFSAKDEGLDPVEVHKSFHVRDRDGRIVSGVDAFICIWDELEVLRFLAPVARWFPVHTLLKVLYGAFALVRPLLPRKSCEGSPYCETKPHAERDKNC